MYGAPYIFLSFRVLVPYRVLRRSSTHTDARERRRGFVRRNLTIARRLNKIANDVSDLREQKLELTSDITDLERKKQQIILEITELQEQNAQKENIKRELPTFQQQKAKLLDQINVLEQQKIQLTTDTANLRELTKQVVQLQEERNQLVPQTAELNNRITELLKVSPFLLWVYCFFNAKKKKEKINFDYKKSSKSGFCRAVCTV
jgi:chromosome segregation ATPase